MSSRHSTTEQSPGAPAWAAAEPGAHAEDPRAQAFAAAHPARPVPATGVVDTSPIACTPSTGFDELWTAVVAETRARSNDIHLPISLAYASRLCAAHPDADRELVMVAVLLHDTGWAHVDESRIISEGFSGDWRKAAIRYEHEAEGCKVARRVLPPLGYSPDFIERVCEIIDGHDTAPWRTPWRMRCCGTRTGCGALTRPAFHWRPPGLPWTRPPTPTGLPMKSFPNSSPRPPWTWAAPIWPAPAPS